MEADDLLREAVDPTTPGERLATIFRDVDGWNADPHVPSPVRVLCEALLSHPMLPRELMGSAVWAHPRVTTFGVWLNPSLAQMMREEPSHWYRDMARLALLTSGDHRPGGTEDAMDSLEALVGYWHALGPGPDAELPARGWRLARHLAGLFSLPWPEEPADPAIPDTG